MPGIRRYYNNPDYHSVAIITDDDDEEELAFCENCQKNGGGELSKLKERIYLDANGKRLPPLQIQIHGVNAGPVELLLNYEM